MGKKQKEMLNMKLAEKIYQERRKLGLSQEQFAEQMDISRQAVSKWESGQSMPDLDKVVAMSQIFGVSTDYLLKEEETIPEEVVGGVESDSYRELDEEVTMKYEEKPEMLQELSVEEIASYQITYMKSTKCIALGVFLCIIGVALTEFIEALLMLGLSVGLGLFVKELPLLLCVIVAISLFVPSGFALSKYDYLQKIPFTLPASEKENLYLEFEKFERKFAMGITVGIVIILLGVLTSNTMEIISEQTHNWAWDEYGSGIAFMVCVAIGVYLFVRCGMKMGMYNVLLQREEYELHKKQNPNKKDTLMGLVAGVYWCLITAVFLAYSFITGDWGRSWIIWPVAGCVFGAIATFIALSGGKDKE